MNYKTIARIAYTNVIHKSRKYSFLCTVGLCIVLSIMYLPSDNSIINVLNFNGYRGIYNSSWIGSGVALLTSMFLSLIGFYYIRNSISEDNKNNIGLIIASTPISNIEYCIGKFFSNFLNLSIISIIMSIMCIFLQVIRGEDMNIILYNIFLPFIVITTPTILVISAIAVLFDSNFVLSGSLGNIIYFFIWITLVSLSFKGKPFVFDLIGTSYILPNIMKDLKNVIPDYNMSYTVIGNDKYSSTFIWNGIDWVNQMFYIRFVWCIFFAVIICIIASILFRRTFICKTSDYSILELDIFLNNDKNYNNEIEKNKNDYNACKSIKLKFSLYNLIISDMKANAYGYFWIWYVIILILYSLNFIYDNQILPSILFLCTLPLWSRNKVMKYKNRITPIISSTHYYTGYHILSMFLSNTILYILLNSFFIIKSIKFDNHYYLSIILLISSAMLISSLSLIINSLTNNSKYSEVIFVLLWYIGPILKIYPLDFINISNNIKNIHIIFLYFNISISCLILTKLIQKIKKN